VTAICSICRGDAENLGADGREAGGFNLCDKCRKDFELKNAASLVPLLDRYSEPVMVVDSAGRLLSCNRLAEGVLGRRLIGIRGLLPGEFMKCGVATKHTGCGRGVKCGDCNLRQAIRTTFNEGRPIQKLPVALDAIHNGKVSIRRFTLSTQKVGEVVQLRIEDDGYLPVY